MREFCLSDGRKVRVTAHFDLRYQRRIVALEEIKETIENPDSVTDDKHDADGKKYWKRFGNYQIVVCMNHSKEVPLAKTVFKYLD